MENKGIKTENKRVPEWIRILKNILDKNLKNKKPVK